MKETLKVVGGHTDELNSMKVQHKDYVPKALSSSRDAMRETPNGSMDD